MLQSDFDRDRQLSILRNEANLPSSPSRLSMERFATTERISSTLILEVTRPARPIQRNRFLQFIGIALKTRWARLCRNPTISGSAFQRRK